MMRHLGTEAPHDLPGSIHLIRAAGLQTDAPSSRDGFAQATEALPLDDVATAGLTVSAHLLIRYFDVAALDGIHEGLIRDEARLRNAELIEPMHLALALLRAELHNIPRAAAVLTETSTVDERARGAVLVAGLLAHTAALAKDTTVEDVLAQLVDIKH